MKKVVLVLAIFGALIGGAFAQGTASAKYPPGSTSTIPTETTTTTTTTTTVVPDGIPPDTGSSGTPGPILPDTGSSGLPGPILPDTGSSGTPGPAQPGTGSPLPRTGSDGMTTSLAIGGVALLVGIGLIVVAGLRRRNHATPSPA